MPVPLFSLGFYKNETIYELVSDLSPEQTFNTLPEHIFKDVDWNTFNRDDIFKMMPLLLVGESFRVAQSAKLNIYIIITKQSADYDIITINSASIGNDKEAEGSSVLDDDNSKDMRWSSICSRLMLISRLCFV